MSYEVVRVHTVKPVPKGPRPTVSAWESEVHVDSFPDIGEALDRAIDEISKPLYRALADRFLVRVEVRLGAEVLDVF